MVSTALAIGTWRQVVDAAAREQRIADWRVAVTVLGSAVREQYVHQAHTYVEGGGGHLAHGGDTERLAEEALARVQGLPLAEPERAIVDGIARDQLLVVAFFREEVAPEALAGRLDRTRATELHATTEALTARVTDGVGRLLARLDALQAAERASASLATTRAWQATLGLTVGGIGLVLLVARGLARAVLAPAEALKVAARRLVAGERPPEELGEIALAMDELVRRLHEAEEKRVRSERLEALGEMSAAVAHELLNPLAVILGDLALRDDPSLGSVREEALHARRVVEGLLGFARPGAEAPVEVDLPALAQAAVDRLAMKADARGVALVIRALPGGVRPTASPSAVRQVLDNLVGNAVLASPAGVTVEVEAGARRVSVLDRGAGLPPEVRARLYEPFVTGREGGTGLGLAVCHRISRAVGATLVHADRDGGGTVASWSFDA